MTQYYYVKRILLIGLGIFIFAAAWKFGPLLFLNMNFVPPPITISAEHATQETWHKKINAIGSLEALNSIMVMPEVSGVVTNIPFEPSKKVQKGDLLLQLNDEVEEADLARCNAQVKIAEINIKRSKKLTGQNIESQSDYDQKASVLEQAKATAAQALAVINKKKILAPFDGIMGIQLVDIGQYIQSGTAIATLTDPSQLYINFSVPERYSNQIKINHQIIVKVDAFPDKQFIGKITAIDPQIKEETRNILVQGILDNPDNLLASGMFADIQIILSDSYQTTVVPETAVDYGLYGSSVYIVTAKNNDGNGKDLQVNRQYVKVGERRGGKVSLLEGVNPNDYVVTSGQIKLTNGASVIINNQNQLNRPSHITRH